MRAGVLAALTIVACGRGDAPAPTQQPPAPAPLAAPQLAPEAPGPAAPAVVQVDPLIATVAEQLARRHPNLLAHPETHRFQFVLTKLNARGEPEPTLTYRAGDEYVYPASAIKTFASAGAMMVFARLREDHPGLTPTGPIARCPRPTGPCPPGQDPSNEDGGAVTLAHEARKMHLVSNNDSFNFLYDFVGHEAVNRMFWDKGFASLRMRHRMFSRAPEEVQRRTPRLQLSPRRGKKVEVPARDSKVELPANEGSRQQLGSAYIDPKTNARVDEPMDFAEKNAVSLEDLHRLTLSIVRPGAPGTVDLGIPEDLRQILVNAMTQDPLESKNPVYTGTPDDDGKRRYKPLYIGVERVVADKHIRYINKAGKAYGFLLDSAVIENVATGQAFAITVSIYANENGVLNDDVYGYADVSRPVLRDLGEILARELLVAPK